MWLGVWGSVNKGVGKCVWVYGGVEEAEMWKRYICERFPLPHLLLPALPLPNKFTEILLEKYDHSVGSR